jgi:hypothetical protein
MSLWPNGEAVYEAERLDVYLKLQDYCSVSRYVYQVIKKD